jgi:hypothetical protein
VQHFGAYAVDANVKPTPVHNITIKAILVKIFMPNLLSFVNKAVLSGTPLFLG